MKRNTWMHFLMGGIFAFILSVSTVGCLATGFDLPVQSIGALFLGCGLLALFSALLLRFRFGGVMVLCLSALAGVLLWKQGTLADQLQTLLLTITTHYHIAYNWPAIGAFAAEEVDLTLMVIGWWTTVSVSFCFCRRKPLWIGLPSVVLPLTVCLIVTNTVPDAFYLYLLILATALLLLTDWTRRKNPAQSTALTARMAVPVAAVLALLFALNPKEEYVNRAGQLQKDALTWFQEFQQLPEKVTTVGIDTIGSEKLSLRAVGPKSNISYAVMRVNSPVGGTLYLRGQDYDTYTGTGWETSLDRSEVFTPGRKSAGTLTITTYGTRNLLYVPYYVTDEILLQGGRLENEDNLTRYSYSLALSPDFNEDLQASYIYTDFDISPEDSPNLKLGDSRIWAEPLAQEIIAACTSLEEKVAAIGDFVRNSATYDLNTSRMSSESDDFAQWFLEESDIGYCVHFATAATVLLRAAGIPARYVEGYMAACTVGEEVVISSTAAHAWAEYYDIESSAWRILEATPADLSADETEPSEAPLPVESEPAATTSEPTESRDEQTEPSAKLPDKVEFVDGPFKLPEWVKDVAAIALLVLAIFLQGELRIRLKHRIWNRGKPNEKALNRWKQSEHMSRLLHIPLPEELDSLAQKARFSQHTLTREELQQFDRFRRDALKAIAAQPVYRRWFLRWILALG